MSGSSVFDEMPDDDKKKKKLHHHNEMSLEKSAHQIWYIQRYFIDVIHALYAQQCIVVVVGAFRLFDYYVKPSVKCSYIVCVYTNRRSEIPVIS
jgi:hypothetical protein